MSSGTGTSGTGTSGTMRVARTIAPSVLEYADAPAPSRRAGEALVAIHTVSLCGTDLHIFAEADYPAPLPMVQGHELAGVVVAADEGGIVEVGDRVAIDPLIACGSCRACRTGRPNVCRDLSVLGCYEHGGLAELLAVPTARLHRVPDALPLEIAALGEPASIALRAVERSEGAAGQTAVVLGCGPIGLLATLGLAERGVAVVACDTDPARAALAASFGAAKQLVVDADFPGGAGGERIAALTDGDGPEIIIEATGVPASLQNAVRLVASAGRIVQVGISARPASLRIKDLTDKEVELRASRNSIGLIGEGLAMLARHPEAWQALVTHRFPFAELEAAFRTMADPAVPTGKILITMPAAGEQS